MILLKKGLIVAHRCGYHEAGSHENSIAALKYCNSKGYIDGVELDCILTKDKKLAVFHDVIITKGTKIESVSKLTFEELDNWYYDKNKIHLSTLDQMLNTISISKTLFIEIKNSFVDDKKNKEIIKLVNQEIKKHKLKKTKVMCFSEVVLNEYYKINSKEDLCLLVSKSSYLYNPKLAYNMYFNKKINIVAIHKSMLTKNRAVKILKKHFLAVYTIKKEKEIKNIMEILDDLFYKYKNRLIFITTIPKIVYNNVNSKLE